MRGTERNDCCLNVTLSDILINITNASMEEKRVKKKRDSPSDIHIYMNVETVITKLFLSLLTLKTSVLFTKQHELIQFLRKCVRIIIILTRPRSHQQYHLGQTDTNFVQIYGKN